MTDYRYLYEVLGRAIDACFGYLEKEDALSALLILMNARGYCAELEMEQNGGSK